MGQDSILNTNLCFPLFPSILSFFPVTPSLPIHSLGYSFFCLYCLKKRMKANTDSWFFFFSVRKIDLETLSRKKFRRRVCEGRILSFWNFKANALKDPRLGFCAICQSLTFLSLETSKGLDPGEPVRKPVVVSKKVVCDVYFLPENRRDMCPPG